MPNRILREGILTSERVEALNWAEEVFYRRLMSVVDDFGRYYARPSLLRAACYPLLLTKVSDSDIEKWLSACENAALVSLYPALDGKRYLQLLDFKQQVRATVSKFPQPTGERIAPATHPLISSEAPAHLGVSVSVSEDVKPAPQAFVCPEWIPAPLWAAYIAVRKKKKAADTDHSLDLIVRELLKIKAAGHDPIACLETSVRSSWIDVYAPKHQGFAKPAPNITVPGKTGPDPELLKRERDAQQARPAPASVQEFKSRLKQGATA